MNLEKNLSKTDWIAPLGYGVFFHYLYGPDPTQYLNDQSMYRKWDCLKVFDVNNLVRDILKTGAKYVFFTLGQNSGYFCAPNAAYDSFGGYTPDDHCLERDIPMQLIDKLAEYNIPVLFYLPVSPPIFDDKASRAMGVEKHWNDGLDQDWIPNETVTENWAKVVKEWSLRYGKKCHGWWFDGFFDFLGFTEKQAEMLKAAALSGNEDSIITFNKGLYVEPANKYCDYGAGEHSEFDAYPAERVIDGSQWHILSYLGNYWCDTNVRYTGEEMTEYIKKVNEKGGIVTVDMYIADDGSLDPEQLKVMETVKENLR